MTTCNRTPDIRSPMHFYETEYNRNIIKTAVFYFLFLNNIIVFKLYIELLSARPGYVCGDRKNVIELEKCCKNIITYET